MTDQASPVGLRGLAHAVRARLADGLLVIGVLSVLHGVAAINRPAAWILGGVLLIYVAYCASKAASSSAAPEDEG